MKQVFFLFFLMGNPLGVPAQPNVGRGPDTSQPGCAQWDLNQYVWSHTHPTLAKGNKPPLDFEAIDSWPVLNPDKASISPDGRYFAYTIERGSYKRPDSLVVQSTNNPWRKSFFSGSLGFFSGDSKQYIFQDKETLCYLPTGGEQPRYVQGVASYQLPRNDRHEWLAYTLKDNNTLVLQNLLMGKVKHFNEVADYSFDESNNWLVCQLNNESKDLLIYNLATGRERVFSFATGYLFHRDGKSLLMKIEKECYNKTTISLQYVNLPEGATRTIWETSDTHIQLSNYTIDGSGRQVVFMVKNADSTVIWYYAAGMDKAVTKVNNQTAGIDPGLIIQGTTSFTDNDRYIQFSLQPQPDSRKPCPDAVQLDIWSYQDTFLQATQTYLLKEPVTYKAIINVKESRVTCLEKEHEKLYLLKGDFAVIKKPGKEIYGDRYWEKDYYIASYWVMSLKDNTRRLLPAKGGLYYLDYIWFSPEGNYLVYFDAAQDCHYFSYDLRSGKIADISVGVPAGLLGNTSSYLLTDEKPRWKFGIAAWIEKDGGLLVYDYFDIWQLDITGKKPAINLTNGYGRLHEVMLSLLNGDRYIPGIPKVTKKEALILKAFNLRDKYNGFFRKSLGMANNPELLFRGPCFMQGLRGLEGLMTNGMQPLKATEADTWIVQRQTATEAPNYFVTMDFKKYKPLTNLQPQKNYNWLTTALVSFPQLDGTLSQGVLYKPENFDSSKTYPLIITFYAQLSDRLYQYPVPAYINRPTFYDEPAWFVSHGYLVFSPDIYFSKGQWGPSTVNTIDGAARYLRTLPYVDSQHIGACGHSNSGRFAYYLLTHSQSFAAMSVGAGTTNIISGALRLNFFAGQEESNLQWGEIGSYPSGTALGNLWQNKESWLDHTAVLHADQVTSPVLLFHNKKDGAFAAGQALEMFISLRRLEKKVWWLQYDEGLHSVHQLKDLRDLTIRYTQFFDHYLKGAPPPRWMIEGLPFKLKGIESRYELDW